MSPSFKYVCYMLDLVNIRQILIYISSVLKYFYNFNMCYNVLIFYFDVYIEIDSLNV